MVKNKHVKIINEISEELFRQNIEKEYPELFQGIGLMDSEISIKLSHMWNQSGEFLKQCRNC